MTLPFMSVIVTMVLLNVARICATPLWMFLLPLALTIFGCSMLSGLREDFPPALEQGQPLPLSLPSAQSFSSAPVELPALPRLMRRLWAPRFGLRRPRVLAPLLSQQPWVLSVSWRRRPPVFLTQPLNFSCFGVFVTNDSHGFTRTFAGAGVRAGALATNRQAPPVPNPAITIDRLQTFEVALHFTTQIAFNRDLVARDRMNNFV